MTSFSAAKVLILVGLFIPFESYISYLSGVEGVVAIAIKLAPELLIFFTLAIGLVLPRSIRLQRSPIDVHLLLLAFIALCSTLIYAESYVAALNNLRALFRFVAVFYLVYYFGFTIQSWKRFLSLIVVVIVVNVVFSMAQFALGDSYPEMLKVGQKVRVALENVYEVQQIVKEEKIGAVQGLLEAPGVFGLFLIAAIVFLLCYILIKGVRPNSLVMVLLFFTLASSFFTYSKTAFVLAALTVAIFFYQYSRRMRSFLTASSVLFLFCGFLAFSFISAAVEHRSAKKEEVSAVDNLMNLFSPQYWDHFFQAERGWVLKEVGGQIVSELPIFGYSPDQEAVKNIIASSSDGRLAKLLYYTAFEDVYWVALLAYFGVFGLVIFLVMLYRLYREGRFLLVIARECGDKERMVLAAGFLTLLVMSLPYCFFERALEINIFSYYFWFFAGLVCRHSQILRKSRSVDSGLNSCSRRLHFE